MFDPQSTPRIFAVPLGVDFPQALVRGLDARLKGRDPAAGASVEILVPSRRMARRLHDLLATGPARLLPRIRTIADLGRTTWVPGLAPPVSPLRRRLELTRLVSALLEREPDLAPRSSLYDLADSLAALMEEMQGEGVDLSALHSLDPGDLSGHWQRSLRFLAVIAPWFGAARQEDPDPETRQRLVVEHLVRTWRETPPAHPLIIAGSTGSRGTTAMLMQAVAQLPNGAVVLPGVDGDLPAHVWQGLRDPMISEDHPQYRFARLADALDIDPATLPAWAPEMTPVNPARNRLVSLALRPAPVTDQWLAEGHRLDRETIDAALSDLTLIEAPSPRTEALAIALRLRKAAEDRQKAALITPDRTLARQVTAALARWGIEPDDSAGRPLALSAPGRFLRHVSELMGQRLTAVALLTLLKHPLTASGSDRGNHLRWTRDLELGLLRPGLPFPAPADLTRWAREKYSDDAGRQAWAQWLANLLEGLPEIQNASLTRHLETHINLAERLAAGPDAPAGSGGLWDEAAGRTAADLVAELRGAADAAGNLSARDYQSLFRAILSRGEVHDPDSPHPGVMIWGTLEARVQGADLVILAGLNEGTWPEMPPPDPWLNREMRREAGLLLPDRRIGLSAHDFQQAITSGEVILSRAIRNDEAETVASRWLLRLKNLLSGLPAGGEAALDTLRARGQPWLDMAAQLDEPKQPLPPAPRPSPRPPAKVRPNSLPVTRISLLIRDPYAIYAERILDLCPLNPLFQTADAALRGTVLHKVMERFMKSGIAPDAPDAVTALLAIADEVLETEVPWPAARILWRARLTSALPQFLKEEVTRRRDGHNLANEVKGKMRLDDLDFTLTAKADRIDQLRNGALEILDYKTTVPSAKARHLHDKQLLLEALIAEAGGFDGITPRPVARVTHVPLGKPDPSKPQNLTPAEINDIRAGLHRLIAAWQDPALGYTAQRLDPRLGYPGDYQHLARFGEWDLSSPPAADQRVGQ